MIFETHMHLFDSKYGADNEKDRIIKECLDSGVSKMIVVGYGHKSSIDAINMAEKYDFIYASIGLHPSEVQKEVDNELNWIYELARNPKVIAIGEIGLDYYWDKTYEKLQKEMFIKQIKIANELKLPIIVHSRDAINETYDIMERYQSKGVLHCFSSSLEMAIRFTKLGYYIGVGGVVTFKNSKELKRVVSNIDIKYLLSETDSPYLAPVPFRGEINKPSYLKYIIEEISSLKNLDYKSVERLLYNNACALFNINEEE